MSQPAQEPPKLKKTETGEIDNTSLADLLEFFLNFDQRVALIRHPHVEELFQWKQAVDAESGVATFPFENAEARFAIGVIQAVGENDTKDKLQIWISSVLQALGEAKQTNEDIGKSYGLDQAQSHIQESMKIPSDVERKVYLTSCWFESLCTAEVRFLGYVFQEIYGVPFEPVTD
jgi:hypothetical protein